MNQPRGRWSGIRGAVAPLILLLGVFAGGAAQAQEDRRPVVAVLPLRPGSGTAPQFAEVATSEVRAFLSRPRWMVVVESDRVGRVLEEIARSRSRDYDPEQALAVGRQLAAEWVCSGTVDAYIYKLNENDEKSWWGAVRIQLEATSLKTGAAMRLRQPLTHAMCGLTPDEAKKLIADCARTAGQMAGDQIAQWTAPGSTVIEADGKRCLLDLGSSHGIAVKQEFDVTYQDTSASGQVREKTDRITVDRVGGETAGARIPGSASIRIGDQARLIPNLRSKAGGGLGSFGRTMVGGLLQNPNVRGAVGDAKPVPYTGPPVSAGIPPLPK
jgi:hypothetical protein